MKNIYYTQVAIGQPFKRIVLNARIVVCRHPNGSYAKNVKPYEESIRETTDQETWEEIYKRYDDLPVIQTGDIILEGRKDATHHLMIAVRIGHINDRWKESKRLIYQEGLYNKVELLDPLPESCIVENDHDPDRVISGFAKNDLRYSVTKQKGKVRMTINIRLNDECNNGHQDFAITCDGYELAKNRHWVYSFGGCCHEIILKFFPQFKPFVDLHLSDRKGTPMYAIENGYFWLREYLNKGKEADVFQKQMRLTDDEVKHFELCDDKEYFCYLLYNLGIVTRWEEEARQAISLLEKLINDGTIFLDDSVKENIRPLSPNKIIEIEKRIHDGYYTAEKVEERRLADIEAKKQERIKKLKASVEEKIRKEKENLQVHLYILEAGLSDDNFIYYDHNKKAVFNWSDSSYYSKITQEQFVDFISKVDYSKLPEGIVFELKSM